MSAIHRRGIARQLVPLVASMSLAACDRTEQSSARRSLSTVTIDDAQVELSVELSMLRTGAHLTSSHGGRGALPDGVVLPNETWRPRPVIDVRRGSVALELVERHPHPDS